MSNVIELFSQKKKQIVLSGIKPSANIHIGNYIGAILPSKQYVGNSNCYFVVEDLHSLTQKNSPHDTFSNNMFALATYIAAGFDPKECNIFIQSDVKNHTELMWYIACHTPLGSLNKMTKFKDRKTINHESLGLYAFPVLKAAEILLYRADIVVAGEDQDEHLELTRAIARSFNKFVGKDILKEPRTPTAETHKTAYSIKNLNDSTKKMSQSTRCDNSRINIIDTNDTIAYKINKFRTDTSLFPSNNNEAVGRLEAQNVVSMYSCLQDSTPEQVYADLGGKKWSQVKDSLTDSVISHLEPMRNTITSLLRNDLAYLQDISILGAAKAMQSNDMMHNIKKSLGLSAYSYT